MVNGSSQKAGLLLKGRIKLLFVRLFLSKQTDQLLPMKRLFKLLDRQSINIDIKISLKNQQSNKISSIYIFQIFLSCTKSSDLKKVKSKKQTIYQQTDIINIIHNKVKPKKIAQKTSITMSESKKSDNPLTVMQIATQLVDSVTHNLFSEIKIGHLKVDDQERPLQIYNNNSILNSSLRDDGLVKSKSKSKINVVEQMKSIDLDQHKKMIKKFMSENRKFRKNREMRSVEMSQRSIKIRQQEDQQKQLSRNKLLEQRRKSIEQRLQAKRNLFKQIQKSTLQSNTALASVRKRKFLYQQKQEQYYKKVILPKIEEQKQIIQAKKNKLRKPMDINQILEHQKSYEEYKMNSRINRSLTISVIKSNEEKYHPPQFVPQSYKRAKEEEENQRLEREIREKQGKVNQIRKKEFMRRVDQARERERELQKELEKERPESPKKQQVKQKVKPQLNRQQQKSVGNQYLRELLLTNRKISQQKKQKSQQVLSTEPQILKAEHKTEYEIEIIKQQRIERVHKIRTRKIQDIMHDKHLDEHTKRQKLIHEVEKLDSAAEQKFNEGKSIETVNQSALIMMNAIQAKMALLGIDVEKGKST